MEDRIEAFIGAWMRDHRAVLEEIVLLQGDDPSTPYGAAMAACLDHAAPWADVLATRPGDDV
ncbi:hypothetical protein [Brevundimonas sp. UBA2416]|uniref:hypothetical protein n=1 Tax=Brevundimonas sp. UBA2416 TaxID=1946124 RepID=UPI0025C36F9A|nr:hypothetical protein [Brevundimonas sp. UBA2416]